MSLKWLAFVVDTDTYAGNFERSLLAYVTGRKQDNFHDHDEKTADRVQTELPQAVNDYFDTHLSWGLDDTDDVPMQARCMIYPTPGWFNDGMGGHFKEGQETEAFETYKRSIAKYKEEHKGATLEASTKLNKCPAYQSVAIFIDEVPPPKILNLMKKRAADFCKDHLTIMGDKAPPIELLGFRFVEEHVTHTERPA